ncbi:MAG: amidohydrolase [Dehalococcoidia bacterium]|nr:amidohydrolase [Dehalococcoidia bacterium]
MTLKINHVSGAKEAESVRSLVQEEVEGQRAKLIDLSLKIHRNPELGFQEVRASRWLTGYLRKKGFRIEMGVSVLATAFRATYGSGKPQIALMAEYDALPEIGHGCGHNLIAASAVGAATAAKIAVERYGGTITVLGTPAEEIYGGKAIMAEQGIFADLDMAMMVHPGNRNAVIIKALACVSLEVEFWGRAAHAAAQPEEGINALDAVLQSFNAINSLRQHIKSSARVHGIVTDGGEAANIVPAHSAASFLVRAEDEAYLDVLKERVLNCFQAASLATGARLEHRWGKTYYAPMRSNRTLARLFGRNMELLGHKIDWSQRETGFGSTDMGNVSQLVPSIHPFIAVAPPGVVTHSAEFASYAASQSGWAGLVLAAKALSLTVCDLLASPRLRQRIWREFRTGSAEGRQSLGKRGSR